MGPVKSRSMTGCCGRVASVLVPLAHGLSALVVLSPGSVVVMLVVLVEVHFTKLSELELREAACLLQRVQLGG